MTKQGQTVTRRPAILVKPRNTSFQDMKVQVGIRDCGTESTSLLMCLIGLMGCETGHALTVNCLAY